MPKQGRVADTIRFIRQADVPANAENWRAPVADFLAELAVSPAIDAGMSLGTAGTELTRKYRRAMILIRCVLDNVTVIQAKHVVGQYTDLQLPAALGALILYVQRVVSGRLNLPLQRLLATPDVFLAANRIKTGRGTITTSVATAYEFSWDLRARFYLMEPPNPHHFNLHVTFQGFNIAVTGFTAVHNVGQIAGAAVAGNIGLTTQLSGCSILYSVNGGNLVVAHVWPDTAAGVRANLPGAIADQTGLPAGALLALRLAHEGGLSNPVGGGTFGIFGMVANPGDVGLRLVGPHNVRTHGYSATLGNAYFIAVKVAGAWRLFGLQNNPGRPAEGVSRFQLLHP